MDTKLVLHSETKDELNITHNSNSILREMEMLYIFLTSGPSSQSTVVVVVGHEMGYF